MERNVGRMKFVPMTSGNAESRARDARTTIKPQRTQRSQKTAKTIFLLLFYVTFVVNILCCFCFLRPASCVLPPVGKAFDEPFGQACIFHAPLRFTDLIQDPMEGKRACLVIVNGVGGAGIVITGLPYRAGV